MAAGDSVSILCDENRHAPSYQQIIGMGDMALPLILRELAREPDHWFWALHAITGADPVEPDARGDVRKMAKAWIEWATRQDILK